MSTDSRPPTGGQMVRVANASLFRTYPTDNLTPQKLSALLRELDAGYCANAMNFFDDMEEKDLHLAAVMQTRLMAAAASPRVIRPASADPRALRHADFAREVWEGLHAKTQILQELLSAIGRGFAIAEIQFEAREGKLVATGINSCPQSLFTFMNHEDPLRLLDFPRYVEPGNMQGVEIPRDKFIYHTCRPSCGAPVRFGLYRGLAWYFLFTNYSIKDWMAFMDIYGIPLRLGKFKPTADDRAREILKQAVQNLGSDAAAVISEDTTIEFIESRLSGSHDLFQNAVEFFNRQKSKRVLGQTLTTEQGQGGSYALGNVHERVRNDISQLDCLMLEETLTRDFIVPLIKANFGIQKNYPVFAPDNADTSGRGQRLDDLKKLYDMGAPVPLSQLYGAAGIAEPAAGEPVTAAHAQGGAP